MSYIYTYIILNVMVRTIHHLIGRKYCNLKQNKIIYLLKTKVRKSWHAVRYTTDKMTTHSSLVNSIVQGVMYVNYIVILYRYHEIVLFKYSLWATSIYVFLCYLMSIPMHLKLFYRSIICYHAKDLFWSVPAVWCYIKEKGL